MCRAVAPCIEVRMAAALWSQQASSTCRSSGEVSTETQQRGKSEREAPANLYPLMYSPPVHMLVACDEARDLLRLPCLCA
jgi:hypothetical protein